MVEADAQLHDVSVLRLQRQQLFLCAQAHHRAHGVGQYQDGKIAPQRHLRHLAHLRVHEGFAAGKADFPSAHRRGFVEEWRKLRRRQIAEAVIRRRGFNIAMGAFHIAERAGIHPQRIESSEGHARAFGAVGRNVRVLKFSVLGCTVACDRFAVRHNVPSDVRLRL